MRSKFFILYLLFISLSGFSQWNNYDYKSELVGVNDEWHSLTLPKEVMARMNDNLTDFRIYSIAKNDTLEIPYLQVKPEEIFSTEAKGEILNEGKKNGDFYATIDVWQVEKVENFVVNQLELELLNKNYDWQVSVQGSHNQKEWFTLAENQRIIDIQNEGIDFNYSKVIFPKSNYRYYRLQFKSDKKPIIKKVTAGDIALQETSLEPTENPMLVQSFDKKTRQTELIATFKNNYRLSELKINIEEPIDYYRPLKIFEIDSLRLEDKVIPQFKLLTSGIIHSEKENRFSFAPRKLDQIKVVIYDGDNQPLKIESIQSFYEPSEFAVRFPQKSIHASNYLIFGNKSSQQPSYDLIHFRDKIPTTLEPLRVGSLEPNASMIKDNEKSSTSWLNKKALLWMLLLAIISVLGWFTFSLLKKVG